MNSRGTRQGTRRSTRGYCTTAGCGTQTERCRLCLPIPRCCRIGLTAARLGATGTSQSTARRSGATNASSTTTARRSMPWLSSMRTALTRAATTSSSSAPVPSSATSPTYTRTARPQWLGTEIRACSNVTASAATTGLGCTATIACLELPHLYAAKRLGVRSLRRAGGEPAAEQQQPPGGASSDRNATPAGYNPHALLRIIPGTLRQRAYLAPLGLSILVEGATLPRSPSCLPTSARALCSGRRRPIGSSDTFLETESIEPPPPLPAAGYVVRCAQEQAVAGRGGCTVKQQAVKAAVGSKEASTSWPHRQRAANETHIRP